MSEPKITDGGTVSENPGSGALGGVSIAPVGYPAGYSHLGGQVGGAQAGSYVGLNPSEPITAYHEPVALSGPAPDYPTTAVYAPGTPDGEPAKMADVAPAVLQVAPDAPLSEFDAFKKRMIDDKDYAYLLLWRFEKVADLMGWPELWHLDPAGHRALN